MQAQERLRAAAEDGRLADWCRAHRIEIVTLFGRAADVPESAHDLDVAIRFRDGEGDVVAAWGDLHELIGPVELDLLDLGAASIVARSRALLGIPLYEAEPGAYASLRDAALLIELDTEWLRRLDLELAVPS